ncbi:hypothetical protein FKM82_015593 [Ascaphus truei]
MLLTWCMSILPIFICFALMSAFILISTVNPQHIHGAFNLSSSPFLGTELQGLPRSFFLKNCFNFAVDLAPF